MAVTVVCRWHLPRRGPGGDGCGHGAQPGSMLAADVSGSARLSVHLLLARNDRARPTEMQAGGRTDAAESRGLPALCACVFAGRQALSGRG